MNIATTAAEAAARYQDFLSRDALIQHSWHSTAADGRELACALSVIGPNINSAGDCPAQIMPRWLAQMVPWFFDSQSRDDALVWGARFYAELARLNGAVPFSVIHDWQSTAVATLAIEFAIKRGRSPAPHEAKRDMHVSTLAGTSHTADEWRSVLRVSYADAYAYAYAYAYADADAYAYADADAYADAYAYANAYANAYAYAYANAYANALKRLADGLIECLARAPALEAEHG